MNAGKKFLGLIMMAFTILVFYRVAPCAAIVMAAALIALLALLSSPFRSD